ncbi:hypothetical protein BDR26DRAFT_863776 [Obelidium mucronatum]|nr:hypothetical protein BDR26DRAFT_863776 [Obelidium mucronatum]
MILVQYVAAQQALSLELVELERSQPLGNVDVKALTVEEDVNAEVLVVPGEGDGTNVFGLLGKVAAGVGRGLNAVVEGVESGVSAVGQGVQKAGEALASNSSDTPYLEDAFAVPNALDQISADRVAIPEAQATYSTPATAAYTTTAVGEAPSAKKSPAKKGRFSMTLTKPLGSSSGRPTPSSSPLPSCTTPTPDSVRNTSTSTTTTTTTTATTTSTSASYTPSFTGIPEIREEDYETYEEYLLAQQAASLAIVEQNAYRELSNAEIKEVEEDTIGEENVFLEGLSKRVAGVVKGAVGIVEDGLQDDMFETKTIQELTTAACEGEVVGSVVGQKQPQDHFDTFEEYVAAQQAASLEVVEGAAPLKPEIDAKLANADDSSTVAGGKSCRLSDVAAGAYNAVVRPDVSTPEAKEKTQQGRVNAAAASATVVGILGIVLFKVARSTVE